MPLPGLGGLEHQRRSGTEALADEVVDGGRCQEARYGSLLRTDTLIAQDEHRRATQHRLLGLLAQPIERRLKTLLPLRYREKHRERDRGERPGAELADLLELGDAQDGSFEQDPAAVLRRLV